MGEIQKIAISGFRGINIPPLELDFRKGASVQSMMIYGKNGSGKSSIVDAWEWLSSGRIEHLAREGAEEHAFPHKEAKEGQTWIEIEFTNDEIGSIRIEFDARRITVPKIEESIEEGLLKVRELISYPCHLRYRDLTDFVYKRKAEKYEILSRQMGFGNVLNIQNQMQTVANRLEQELKELQKRREDFNEEYQEVSGESPKDIASFIKTLNVIFNRQGIATVKGKDELEIHLKELREKVEKDQRSQKLSLWKELQATINRFYPMEDVRPNISEFQRDLREFQRSEEEVSKLVLLDLYEKGIEAIECLEIYDECPLCNRTYEGNLIEHIKSKQCHLKELSEKRAKLEIQRKNILLSIAGLIWKIEQTCSNLEGKALEPLFEQFKENLEKVNHPLKECQAMLKNEAEKIDKGFDFLPKINTEQYKSLVDSESVIREKISEKVVILAKDESRKLLVDDFQQANSLRKTFSGWSIVNKKLEKLEEIRNAYEKIKDDYIEETKRNVQLSFDAISSDVATYFKILEQENEVLGVPKIRLDYEKDKAVELEVVFGGDPISPAYKFLSESQLNSFGLSIFLASIKHFNIDFKFIILDDVINSFDAYKRPRVIDLLSEHFSNYQILLLTHDSNWLDRLQKNFPQWIRNHFLGWDYAIGPRMKPGKNSYEQIEDFILRDMPAQAGRTFGVYLEWLLQLLCENCEASVKYNRQNEFTLSELFQAFRKRLQKKLKKPEVTHSIVELISNFETDIGFRNFCAHWKDPEIPYTSPEIEEIVKKWKIIESNIECDNCHKFIKYQEVDGYEHITCPCRELDLKDASYYH